MLAEVEPGFGARTGTFHTPDSACYMIHQGHLGTHNLHKGGPLRSLLFWWLFGSMNRDWWARFLDRFGAPFLVGKFNDGDDEGRAVLESAFSAASKLLGVVVNNETEVDVVQAMGGNATGEAFEKFRDICRREMAILVQGQNLSSESSSTGLGSGTSDLQGQVRDDMTEFDQARLGMTLERLARQFLEINGQYGLVRVQFGGKKSADIVRLGSAMASFKQAGLILADEALPDLSEEVGFKIVRDSAPALGSVTPFSADLAHTANEDAVKTASVRLSRLLRENLAPIREILAASQSTADLESRLGEFMAALSLDDRATVTEELLLALASNGASQPFS